MDVGITLIDNANVYGGGDNERLIARLLADRCEEVIVATKFGIVRDPGQTTSRTARGDAAYVRRCCDESLGRLDCDVIDLYYLHRRDRKVPIEEAVGAMADLVAAGKVRHLGLSEVTPAEIRAAAAVQSEWSIWSRVVEAEVIPTVREVRIGFVPYAPLGRGFLTGTVRSAAQLPPGDRRRNMPRFVPGALDVNLAVLAAVDEVASELAATPAQIALAWLRHRGRGLGIATVPIPGTHRAVRVDENVGSLGLELNADHVIAIDAAATVVVGDCNADPEWVSAGRL